MSAGLTRTVTCRGIYWAALNETQRVARASGHGFCLGGRASPRWAFLGTWEDLHHGDNGANFPLLEVR